MPLTLLGDLEQIEDLEEGAQERTNILIVDDLPEQLLVLETILADLDQNLVFARSGSDALREVLQREFAVILLDVNMPDLDGFETARMIRKYKRSAHTPIIFVTAYADEMQTARGYSLGAVDYILSPVVPEVLRSKLRVFVELNIMQRQLRRRAKERVALAAAEAARRFAEQNTLRSNFLSQASRVLSASLDIDVGKRSLLELIVPELADTAIVLLQHEQQGKLRFDRALRCDASDNGTPHRFSEWAFEELATPIQEGFNSALNKQDRVELASEVTRCFAQRPFASPLGSQLGGHGSHDVDGVPERRMTAASGVTVVPLLIAPRPLGAILVHFNGARDGAAILDELASRAAIAFENALLYRSLQNEIVEREHVEAMLQDINQRKDEFLAMLSHELRNPLAPIRNAIEVIRMLAPADAKLTWATDVTERQVDHLTRLIEELLDVARISQGKIVLQNEPVDLLQVVAQSVETVRPYIDVRRHGLTQKLPSGPIWLRGDFARLSQVISNLLNNAAKYTEEQGTIHLAVSVEDGQAVISVRDNGIGIEEDLLPRVFDLFKQGNRSLDRSQGGLGVGLTLAQRLVQLHNGRIEVFSAGAGRGAEFRVLLPCLTEVKQLQQERHQESINIQHSAHCRVLVVDDNRDAAQTVAAFLELAGHEVKAVGDGMQAVASARIFAPEVVVLDIGLPMLDGYEVAQQLRASGATRASLLIALTGYGQDSDKKRAKEVGFDHHLVKPANPAELVKLIAEWRASSSRLSDVAPNEAAR